MSMMRCDNCDRFIDTDFDSEHFEECQAVSNLKRDIEKMIERVAFQAISDYGSKGETPTSDNELIKEATTQIINLIESVLPDKLSFKPKNNSSCSFEMADTYANPCEYCGGTRLYEWREFTKKYGFTPNDIDGYNQAIKDIKSKLIGGSNGKE